MIIIITPISEKILCAFIIFNAVLKIHTLFRIYLLRTKQANHFYLDGNDYRLDIKSARIPLQFLPDTIAPMIFRHLNECVDINFHESYAKYGQSREISTLACRLHFASLIQLFFQYQAKLHLCRQVLLPSLHRYIVLNIE